MNLIFNASAGTGKTWQMTELYCALVLGRAHEHLPERLPPVDPEKILLMTFTDNAAAELRGRVSQKMIAAETTALESGDDDLADRARRVLRLLPAAKISTIHAFCAGLLREYALECGLSPAFQTLEEDDREILLEETLKQEIFEQLATDEDFQDFCSGVQLLGDSDYSVLRSLRALLEKAASRGLDLSRAEEMLPPPEQSVSRRDFERIRDELNAGGFTQKSVLSALDALDALLADFPNPARAAELPKFGRVKAAAHLSDELAELKERLIQETVYIQQFDQFRAFARCLAGADRRFAEAKRERDVVDFGDQLLFARDLLRRKPFDEPPFEWILVDEVQDTSRVQCEVIEALWAESVNLVICGDRKQSIYAWRSADPNVMLDLEAAMNRRGRMKQIALKQSRRSKDRVLDAVNGLFDLLMEEYASAALEPVEEIGAVTDGEGPCVEFLVPDDEEQGTEEEMAAVARRIRLLVDGGSDWRPRFGFDGDRFAEGEPVNYGDILILLKRSTHLTVLEKALREADVPFTSGGKGRALFEQQEVRDLLLLLQVLTQPFNDLALIGFMRSPFANVPDDELVALGWDGETFGHEILRRQFLESGSDAAERMLRYREQTGTKLASQLIREMVQETAFDAQLAGEPGGEQKLANFKKALDWIRSVERSGQMLIGDVVRRFEKAIKTPPAAGAAEALLPDPEQNAVTLMTVHGAKGLTKRVCFIPDISFGDVNEPGLAMFSPEGRLELSFSDLGGGRMKSPGWDAARRADRAVRATESLNLFYVAMTRARDLTVLSGSGTRRPDGWLKLADEFLNGGDAELLCRRRFSELPEMETESSEAVGEVPNIRFVPLAVPPGPERKAVTGLVEHAEHGFSGSVPSGDRRAFGTLGHLVLEELAKSGWIGDIAELTQCFSGLTGPVETEKLIPQLESAREVLRRETDGAELLSAEHSFVMRRDNLILDGTIDLLAKMPGGWKIFDYKFSNESPETASAIYAPQLAAYREAVARLHSGESVSAVLVLIGESVLTVQMDGAV